MPLNVICSNISYKICHHFVTNFVRLKPTATFVQEMYKSSTYFVIFSLQDMYILSPPLFLYKKCIKLVHFL